MRRYDDQVEVRRGPVGPAEVTPDPPAQFMWRGRLWQVRSVLAHWIETAPWWHSTGARAVIGTELNSTELNSAELDGAGPAPVIDLVAERELWRVEAGRGPEQCGVFELAFSGADGRWQLVGCVD